MLKLLNSSLNLIKLNLSTVAVHEQTSPMSNIQVADAAPGVIRGAATPASEAGSSSTVGETFGSELGGLELASGEPVPASKGSAVVPVGSVVSNNGAAVRAEEARSRFVSKSAFVVDLEDKFKTVVIGVLESGLRRAVKNKIDANIVLLPKENNAIVNSVIDARF